MQKIIVLLIAISSFGCAKADYYPEYKVQLIQRPNPPILLELDNKKHLGNKINVDRMLENTKRLLDYAEALNDTIDKYEIQAGEEVELKK